MSLTTLLLVVVVLLIIFGAPANPYGYGRHLDMGYGPSGIGAVLLVLLVLWIFFGR